MEKQILKNLTFAPAAVLMSDGKDMLYLRPREEIDLGKVNLNQNHLNSMIKKGYVAIRTSGGKAQEPAATEKGTQTEKEQTTAKKK